MGSERKGGPVGTEGSVDLCLAAPNFYPTYAGPAVRFRSYAPGLAERDVEMKVFTVSGGEDSGGAATSGAIARAGSSASGMDLPVQRGRVDEIPVYRLASGTNLNDFHFFRGLVRFCSHPTHRPDVLQLLELNPSVTPWLWQLARLEIPLVFTQTMVTRMSDRPWKRMLQKLYWPLPYRFLDCVIVSSGIMREELREIGVQGRVEVIPNGVNVQHFSPLRDTRAKADLRRELGLPPSAPVLLYVGSISPRKGIDILAQAWERLAPHHEDCRLVLVGPRHDEIRPGDEVADFFELVDTALDRSGARDRVIFTGAVDDVRPYLQAADLFVFPSRREGMPNVVPEAFASGLATIMAPFVGLPEEFGRPGEHYILVEHEPERMARAISGLLDDSDRRRELGRAARELAARELPLTRSLDEYAGLYRELAAG